MKRKSPVQRSGKKGDERQFMAVSLPLLFTIFILLLVCQACNTAPPNLTGIAPSTAYPRQIVGVEGTGLNFGSIVWDDGQPGETVLSGNFLAARYFQVPAGAAAGDHPVKAQNSEGKSAATVNVTVLAPSGAWPQPRVEDIQINSMFNVAGANADFFLAVPAANADADATVLVNGVAVPTIFTSAIPIDFLSTHTPTTFAYPIYHYTLLVAFLDDQAMGGNISVVVQNNDGVQSAARNYTLPASLALLDSDNDGLLDTWEKNGYPAPSGATIDLAAMGCDPLHKDILIEADWIAAATPQNAVWGMITTAFDQAPVLNPNGTVGISVHIDRGQGGAFNAGGTVLANHTTMDFGPLALAGYTDFYTYKTNNFNADRTAIFHYCVFGRARPNNSSGRGEINGNDFMVTFANGVSWGNALSEANTFTHELGHNLNLGHGAPVGNPGVNETFKVNQASTMNYRYQFPGVSNDCNLVTDGVIDYSQGIFNTITEQTVQEGVGICDGFALDYNFNGATNNVGPMSVNCQNAARCDSIENPSPPPPGPVVDIWDVHVDYDEWGALNLKTDAGDAD